MEQVYPGMAVEDANGLVGTVQAIEREAAGGTPRVHIMRHDGTRMTLTPNMFSVVGDVLHLVGPGMQQSGDFDPYRTQALPTGDQLLQSQTNLTPQQGTIEVEGGQELRIPVIREEVVVRTRQVERGGVRVHKTVGEREEVVEQPTYHEDVQVERIAIGQQVDRAPAVREEGDTLIIPVVEEMLVVEKRLVLKEEIRITRHRTQTIEQARVMLREEQIRIEDLSSNVSGVQRMDDQRTAGT